MPIDRLVKNFTLIKGIAACNGTIERPIKLIASLRPGVFLGTPQSNGGLFFFHHPE
ncbi:hypothetical protein [Dolichospermum sp. UHCC 0352]|uniref:hypothetical protein n=1 Tax=Dolichospermum sp. UHCC 0352 TaxID=2590011 RepID=UPI0002E232DD|nr:hypothetical protein [Dolichospermum sp. UHCC 0352]MBO1053873.1 hypothetical protein [Dolichospermum sp. DET73]